MYVTVTNEKSHLLVNIARREICLEPVLGIFVRVIVLQTVCFLDLVVLVVSGIDDKGRVMPEPFHVRNAFFFDGFPNFWVCRVVTTAKHEVLPHKDAKFVAEVVEDVLFPDTSAPDPVERGLASQSRLATR